MKNITKKYSNDDITVVWKPGICIHAGFCAGQLREVFDPKKRPWINMEGATTERIVEQVKKCPSGALSFYYNDEKEEVETVEAENIVEVSANGPLLVYGNITVKDAQGNETKHNRVTALCRCGASGNKPYCDGAHKKIDFKG